ncbi:4-hydroxy-4-methyl-2-oxoglutarate aldolase [Nocardiopsis kunsanensis]|uniref:Putative 4-hydroxy-4-methyl-2-oxoglutarate aldolase n=1 Tax=Nocardiopsis kunsanensis TaxID=141693 RepID=A0A918XAC8_9ACTN|nr:RraA family protein [Nocardiopsis kunsanensis]GHD21409.1 4-hydroxy-4-methyl-2-oxoglutarate aldolase [Nocardiopsis kunsanensis]
MFTINDMPRQIDDHIIDELGRTCVSTLGHLRDHGFALGLQPNRRPLKFVGTAVTVRIPHLDSTAVHIAVDMLRPGDVLVVDQSGDQQRSCFGGLVSYTAKARGAAGAVIDGAVNDYDETLAYDFPVISRGFSPLTTRIGGIEGAINVPVSVAGAVVRPGDVVFADSDGAAFLTPEEAVGLGDLLKSKEDAEIPAREKISAGGLLAEFSGAAKHLP